ITSYAYNRWGTEVDDSASPPLGLGNITSSPALVRPAVSESQVVAPSEMFAISDSRIADSKVIANWRFSYYEGLDFMTWWPIPGEIDKPRHGNGYNTVYC